MAEISRLASIYESRQKGDFIGSISHELRSPLHGILGSAEFLSETNFDAFQGSLVDTISACGRTLLDTIEHILDFSKINSFERNWRNARKPKNRNRSSNKEAAKQAVAKDAPPLMSIYVVTDIAAIVEEVVEGVYAGQVYRDFGSADILDVSAGQRGKTSDRGLSMVHQSQLGGSVEKKDLQDIEVILDMEEEDYCFATQPGALRRVIMNIFGNALKYTTTGRIVVKLGLEPLETGSDVNDRNRTLNITITDTGRGISSDYLRTSLYTAFSQEDVLANGTGLGLSIVRSIVSMLEGTIDIKSQLGQGTDVQIRIPLCRQVGDSTSASTPTSAASLDKLQENSINILQTTYPAKTVAFYSSRSSNPATEQETQTLKMALYYVKKWFKLPVELRPLEQPADVIIVEEKSVPDLLKRLKPGPAIVVLCTKTHRLQAAQSLYGQAIEFMSTPFGPYKLAKAISLSLEKANEISAGRSPNCTPTIHDPRLAANDSILPKFESMNLQTGTEATPVQVHTNGLVTASQSDNARMALGTPVSGASTENRDEFPFPDHGSSKSGTESPRSAFGEMMKQHSQRPKLSSRQTEPVLRPLFPYTSAMTNQGQLATSDARDKAAEAIDSLITSKTEPSMTETPAWSEPISKYGVVIEKRQPRLLLVDDNKINLRLLETFMRKRKYQSVDSALDGSLAVEAARKNPQGYDIIFMDLSMPIMNGFEATRTIRELEQNRDPATYAQHPKPAMIVALTGLASGRDHGEAFACGVDLYMTKPVSFKEVGRLLDNWEAHGGLDTVRVSKANEKITT
ncbi:MAG: hypothetical protein Q9219_004715 [cf. Caloplaca sp. 3 TL-2023]